MKKSIIWLASYPKSGNTWTRIFLANYLANSAKPLSINEAHRFCMGDTIASTYHKVAGCQIDTKDIGLTLRLRPKVLAGIVANNADVNFVKTHHMRRSAGNMALIPPEVTRSAIYIMRNPLDMVLSYARHYGITPAVAVAQIGNEDNANAADENSVAQFLGSWSGHVKSWTSPSPYPVLVLRYEDLLEDPEAQFARVLTHIGIPVEKERLKKAVEFASFKELSRQEESAGFIERPKQTEKFFAKGAAGQWKDDLDKPLIDEIKRTHRKVMKKHGYL
ncbi:sulfotransferase domain-containing protein [Roseovarius sp. LXJ103]|uniref:sulfotransferase domain-containing protein n=1 Tax=Roseovarius carneus TaxID=2853164 RepID=UPI000D6062F9|nr:sulfotransferase domain-containing protein [Roseovarius carneus]MBZ8118814.1 sulfotransferase domain-containing protein [Roseovarius carneus]PWE35517.1 sulfotransferase [Pelagicola sp. LXJ1103]